MRIALRLVPAMLALAAGSAAAGELRATIQNVKPQQGRLWVALYDGPDAYKADRRLAGQFVDGAAAEATVVFAGLAPGRYGLSAFQDLDGDGALGTNLLGVPTEPYGFSRAAAGRFGPPDFEAMAVAVEDGGVAATLIPLTP